MFKFHHICLSVKNVERSINFYKNFDFKIIFQKQFESDVEIVHLKLQEVILEIFCFLDYLVPLKNISNTEYLKYLGIKHFALKVPSVILAKEKLISLGLINDSIEIKTGRTDIQYFFIEDPDGNAIEIVQDDREY